MSAEIKHHRRTRRLLWIMLFAATAGSMAGNIAAAGEHQDAATAAGAIAAAAIPPLALLSLTHLAGMWSRIRDRGVVYWCFLVAVAAIAVAAFRLSFAALRSLAMSYGYGPADAALFPLILDGLVTVCTLGLVVLARIEAGDAHREADEANRCAAVEATDPGGEAARALSEAKAESPRELPEARTETPLNGSASAGAVALTGKPEATSADSLRKPLESVLNSSDSLPVRDESWWRSADSRVDAAAVPRRVEHPDTNEHRRIANRLVDAGRTTLDPDVVHRVLDRTAGGESGRAVAAQLGLSPSAVQRVLKAARDEQPASAGV